MILFCLPYAGGSEAIYYRWRKKLEPEIKVCAVELKGRGRRFSEEHYEDIFDAVDDIYRFIQGRKNNDEYAIYGHSMGCVLAYELYYKIVEKGDKLPKHIFFSGNSAPEKRKLDISAKLPKDKFIEKVIKLGGTPTEVLENKELLDICIPILKNDISLLEKYKYIPRENKLDCNISILNGNKDKYKVNELFAWKKHTNKEFKSYSFEGNHFFINDNLENIAKILKDTLVNN